MECIVDDQSFWCRIPVGGIDFQDIREEAGVILTDAASAEPADPKGCFPTDPAVHASLPWIRSLLCARVAFLQIAETI